MLFDLQSRGRKNAVKVIYTFLALLLGGGLVLFGIGTGTGGGGLFDVFSGKSTNTSSLKSAAETRAQHEVRVNPRSPQAWADLARAQYQGAPYDQAQQAFTATGVAKLRVATGSWQRYLALNPPHPDPNLARLMAEAYGTALNQPANAASAFEIVTGAQPSASSYGALAQFSYLAYEFRKGDLAAARAVQLAPQAQQTLVKKQLATVRKQALTQQAQQAVQQSTTTTPRG